MVKSEISPGLARMHGTWVQTDRSAHEAWAHFLALKGATAASRVLHVLIARMGEKNAVVISQGALAEELQVDPRTIRRAVAMLRDHNWIQTVSLGGAKSGVQAYIVNSRVAWQGARDGIRHSVFDATVYATETEQEDGALDRQEPLIGIPALYPDEMQMPSGGGLPPVSQPALPGMDPDLPARSIQHPQNFARGKLSNLKIDSFENLKSGGATNLPSDEFTTRKIDGAGNGEID